MTDTEVIGETLHLIMLGSCETQLGDRTWRRATLPGYLSDEPKGKPDMGVATTLIDPDENPDHQGVCQLGVDREGELKLTIYGWNLIRCATDDVTIFDDLEAISGEDWDRIKGLDLKTVRVIGLDNLCQWVAANYQYKTIQARDAAMRNALH